MLKDSRWLRFLTVEDRFPLVYSLPFSPPRGRTEEVDGVIVVKELRQWFCNPVHVAHFTEAGIDVLPDLHCPLYSRSRRWRWERPGQ